jgi:hypothetical protein
MNSMLKTASRIALSVSAGLLAVGCAAEVADPDQEAEETALAAPSAGGATEDGDQVGTAEEAWGYGGSYVGIGYPYGSPFYGYGLGYRNATYTSYGYTSYRYGSYGYPYYGCWGGVC